MGIIYKSSQGTKTLDTQDAIRAGASDPNCLCPLVDAKGTPAAHALSELYRWAAPAHRI